VGIGLILSLSSFSARPAGLIVVENPPDLANWPHPLPMPRPTPPPRVVPPRPHVFAPLETVSNQVQVRISDQIAVTVVEQEFYNPNSSRLEGTFLFPVPKGAQLDKFSMEIDGRRVEAELLAADKARGIYEDIVRKMRDPALLEYAGRDLFKVRVYPIEPQSRKRVKVAYSEVLKAEAGLVSYVHPLNTERFSAKPVKNLSLKVELNSKRALKSIYSPSHKIEVRREGDHQATVGYEAHDVRPDTDFHLLFHPEAGEVGITLMTHRIDDRDGYFMLLAAPAFETRTRDVVLKDVAFVLDTSGSMAGNKLEQAKKALQFCVENLNDGDRFEIIRFSTEVEPLFDELVEATRSHRARAFEFIKDLKPIGGTAIDEALRKALTVSRGPSDRPFVVIFLTDGRPTVGVTDENRIVDAVKQTASGNIRVFCFGIGNDVNTHLLDRVTEETRAFSTYVLPEEDLELKVTAFYTKIKEPVLAHLKLTFPEGLRVTKLYPSPLPDLFKGEQLVLAGRYAASGQGRLALEGTVNGVSRSLGIEVKFPERGSDHDFIPRLWATRRVGYLLDEIRLRGDNQELRDEVTALAREYGIVTPYTAYLIMEDEKQRSVPVTMQVMPARPGDRPVSHYGLSTYQSLTRDRSGEGAVAGARSAQALKMANSPEAAIATGQSEGERHVAAVSRATSSQASPTMVRPLDRASSTPASPQQQVRYVRGRTFYQNGAQWTDALVQTLPNAKRVQVTFNSREYFDLVAQHPEAASWVSLGQNVQFVLLGTVYEIVDSPEARR
jgi:Ca-activated chloride channel family protein